MNLSHRWENLSSSLRLWFCYRLFETGKLKRIFSIINLLQKWNASQIPCRPCASPGAVSMAIRQRMAFVQYAIRWVPLFRGVWDRLLIPRSSPFQDVLRKKQQPPVGSTPIGPSAIQQQQQQQIQQMQQEQQAAIASQLSASTVAAAVADAQAQMSESSNLMAAAVAAATTSTAQPTVQTLQHELLKEVSRRRGAIFDRIMLYRK